MFVFVAMLALGVPGIPSALRADEGTNFTLAWEAPPECPSRTSVQAEVARLLGGTITIPQGGILEARASVSRGQAWSVAISTRHAGQTGQRTLEASSCPELAKATALILALMIDPDAVAAHARDPQVEPPPEPEPITSVPPPAKQPSVPLDFLAALHAQGSVGTLPGLDLGAGLGLGVSGPRWRIELRGTYGLRRDQVANATTPPGAYGQFNFLAASFAGCFNLGDAAVAFGPCADAEVGQVSAKGFGSSVGYSAQNTWLALGAGGYLAIALGPHLAIPVHLDILAPLRRPEYIIKEVDGRVYQAPSVGGRFQAGIELRF